MMKKDEGYEGYGLRYEGYARGTSFPAPRLLSLSRANFHLRGNRAPHLRIFRFAKRQIRKTMEIRSDFQPLCSQTALFPATPNVASLLSQFAKVFDFCERRSFPLRLNREPHLPLRGKPWKFGRPIFSSANKNYFAIEKPKFLRSLGASEDGSQMRTVGAGKYRVAKEKIEREPNANFKAGRQNKILDTPRSQRS